MEPVKETVIVVHGTFSAKKEEGPPNWYAPNQEFCNKLDWELKNRNSDARCWAHLNPGEDFFIGTVKMIGDPEPRPLQGCGNSRNRGQTTVSRRPLLHSSQSKNGKTVGKTGSE
ncbi:MAG: hypothetical protein GY799_33200 [Desulfobulbaceae bacterium]|nr:hypothetical protein [Desulfobulbaceae bacterium]